MLDMDSQQLNDHGGDFNAHDQDQVDEDGAPPHGESDSLSRQQPARDQVSGALFYNPRLQVRERKGRARLHEELSAEQEAEWQVGQCATLLCREISLPVGRVTDRFCFLLGYSGAGHEVQANSRLQTQTQGGSDCCVTCGRNGALFETRLSKMLPSLLTE